QVAAGVAFVEHATGDGGGAVEDRWAASAPAGRVSLENGAPTGGVEDGDRRAGAYDDQAGYRGHGGENGPAADSDAPERRAHVVRVVCRQRPRGQRAIDREMTAADVESRAIEGAGRDAAVAAGRWVAALGDAQPCDRSGCAVRRIDDAVEAVLVGHADEGGGCAAGRHRPQKERRRGAEVALRGRVG